MSSTTSIIIIGIVTVIGICRFSFKSFRKCMGDTANHNAAMVLIAFGALIVALPIFSSQINNIEVRIGSLEESIKSIQSYQNDFPPEIGQYLEDRRNKLVRVFFDSRYLESFRFACSIQRGLAHDGLLTRFWPDSPQGFVLSETGPTDCILLENNSSTREHYPVDLKNFEAVKNDRPILDIDGVKVLSSTADSVIIWVTK